MIKVRAGQVWELEKVACNYENGDRLRILDLDSESGMFEAAPINIVEPSDYYAVTELYLNKCFKFIPQNDLEWLALQLDKWYFAGNYIYKENGMPMLCSDIGRGFSNVYNRTEWQNMRYHLGQDKKPHYRLTGGEWVKQ